ncbi:hypothetical protein DO659_26120, partial [Salmonella enterica subsp. enterica serovar Minnesota]|nr:hypothetical protein [Salmonella enterica subsp. enterica serovar Minnesota]
GFSLTNITLSQALKDLANVTLSSAGSSASATNAIGKIFDATQVAALINKGIENLTTVNVNGLTLGGEGNDWTNTPSAGSAGKGGTWILSKANVSKTDGNISLENVGFVDSTLTAQNISLTSGKGNNLSLGNTTLNATTGTLNVSSGGNLTSTTGSFTAAQDLTVSSAGNLTLGGNGTSVVNLTSTNGNLTLKGGNTAGTGDMALNNVTLNASSGNVSLLAQDGTGVGVNLTASCVTAVNFLLDNGAGVTSVDGSSRAVVLRSGTAVNVTGNATFNVTGSGNYSMATGGNITAKDIVVNSTGAQLSFQSGTTLNASGNITLDGIVSKINQNAVETTGTGITLQAGQDIRINGTSTYTGSNAGGVVLQNLTLNAASVNLTGISQGKSGNGFYLDNITLQGGVKSNISNLTLNSAGSASGMTSVIGSGIINSTDDFTSITSRQLGTVTQVDATYWSGNNKTYTDGLTLNATAGTDGWLYRGANITVTGGDTVLNNIGFVSPATLNISGNSLTINVA